MPASREGISEQYKQLLKAEALAAANPERSRITLVSGTGPNGLIQPAAYMDAVVDLPGLKMRRALVIARNELRRERQELLVGRVPINAVVSKASMTWSGHLADVLAEGFRDLNTRDNVSIKQTNSTLPPGLRNWTTEIVNTPDGVHVYLEQAHTEVTDGHLTTILEEYEPVFMGPEDPKGIGIANLAALALGTAMSVHDSWR
jgi:hypothetical protein